MCSTSATPEDQAEDLLKSSSCTLVALRRQIPDSKIFSIFIHFSRFERKQFL